MSPAEITYVTKIVDISRVVLRGKLELRDIDPTDKWSHTTYFVGKDNLEEFLDKLDGKHVTLEITVATGPDEAHLDVPSS